MIFVFIKGLLYSFLTEPNYSTSSPASEDEATVCCVWERMQKW